MLQHPEPALILASQSRIRRQLLESAGLSCESRPAAIDEASIKASAQAEAIPPGEAALWLAELKAERIRAPGAMVIGADQLLSCEGRWFDKASDLRQAREQLLFLRGKSHLLHTAVSVMKNGQVIWHHIATPKLTMRAFSEQFLDEYIAAEGEELLHSVGAYRLEGPGVQLFSKIEGDHNAILGLPLLELLEFLRQQGILKK